MENNFLPSIMTKAPTISILMPFYNAELYLREALDGLIAQTWTDWECILIDDASTDNSARITEEYLDDLRIIFIKNQENLGIVKNLNHALSLARGTYIARMDGDDISRPDRLMQQYQYLIAHPEIDFVGGAIEVIDAHGKHIEIIKKPTDPDVVRERIWYDLTVWHTVVLARRSLYDTIGGYRETYQYVEDVDWTYRALFGGHRGSNIESVVASYRRYPQNSDQYSRLKAKKSFALKKEMRERYHLKLRPKEYISIYVLLVL